MKCKIYAQSCPGHCLVVKNLDTDWNQFDNCDLIDKFVDGLNENIVDQGIFIPICFLKLLRFSKS